MNSINNKSAPIVIDPGASGDSFTQFSISSSKFRIGVDDSDSDKFKISSGNALGTNDTYKIQSDGTNSAQLQPAFLVTGYSANETGDGTLYSPTLLSSGIFNIGSHFNTGTNYFVAPVDGYYLLTGNYSIYPFSSSHTKVLINISTTIRDYYVFDCNAYAMQQLSSNILRGSFGQVLAYMDASDTACLGISVYGGAKTVGAAVEFMGSLIC